ncbi:hemicentin-2-like [Pseudomyrmex gracilis]|uniref:hemicentin-2-like n=1 Tax=Pseudomyrmex gracilis TaxID=219809 RepID=UPI000994EB81|nr:hemicentin-2-like [Pseudomyrmex gracilis]XP_020300404.1 hemicentin-2-like [Pseudomyrmex gracilis]XP_020300405.1 hemicentin-2-like [Pseudomyrmex gracilis]XP_020300406.1 hemicentin-2-like [Pseudomyrmex gracilis]XP_020300407.1 hemicentin-2-like [Pseudomyrmex gracilis]
MWWRWRWWNVVTTTTRTTTMVLILGIAAAVYSPPIETPDLNKPSSIVVVEGVVGKKAQLPCNIHPADNDDVSMVLWYKEGITEPIYSVDARNRRQLSNARFWSSPAVLGPRAYFVTATNPAHLTIDRLESTDQGIYRCRVDFRNSPTRKQKTNLTVIVPPSKPIILDGTTRKLRDVEQPYNEGGDVNLICEVRGGKPPPKLRWYLDNTVIDESYHYDAETEVTLNHLVYPKIGREHLKTRLICQASNTNLVPPETKLIVLDMNLKPVMVQILTKETRVSADKNYNVECRTSGSRPEAVITWWKANKQIKKMAQNYPLENNQSLSILSFVPTIEDDGKYLTCRAENPAILDSALEDKWRLDVQYQPVVNLRMGETLNPNDIKEGDDVYFECIVQANPKVYKLAWFKDGKELKNNSTAGVIFSDFSLVLQGLTRYSAGDYTCLAANSEGKTASNPVSLQIMYAPVCKEGKSEVVVGALKQETVLLACSVESHPAPVTYHWTFNNSGELVDVQSRYSHVSASGTPSASDTLKEYQQFRGPNLDYTPATEMDYGTVACWASNQVGKQRTPCLFQVIAAGRPYALHNCSATEMSAPLDVEELGTKSGTGLVVRCLEGYDGGLPIYSYLLEVVADEDGGPILLNKSVPASPNGPTFEVAGLTTGRSYRLFLYAINAKGRSEPAILEPVTLKGVAMYTTGNTNASMLNPLLLGLAAIATLVALIVAGIVAALYRKHSTGRPGSPKHAPIVCEPPNAGATTPVHPQTKQAVDDIDPDIIPNEYERRPLTYTPVYKTTPQRRKKDRATDEDVSPEKRPIVQHGLDLPSDPMLTNCLPTPTINYSQNHVSQQSTYNNPPTMADFKQMAMDAYNQRNYHNVFYSLQRTGKGFSSMPQRPVSSSVSAQGKFHQPEVVTRSNRIQESCI